jgi:phosphoribosyl 1,2-cyclic phosphodiesterase
MILKTVATGSSGNCHLLIAGNGETLILDCGVPIKEIKKGLGWNIKKVVGVLCTHRHLDHSKSAVELYNTGFYAVAPYLIASGSEKLSYKLKKSRFDISAFALKTVDGKWTHTNGDGSECPCYGFWIQHPEMGTMIYATDTELIKWRFKNVNHILLGVNYDQELLSGDEAKKNHVVRGHMSIDTAVVFSPWLYLTSGSLVNRPIKITLLISHSTFQFSKTGIHPDFLILIPCQAPQRTH